MKAFVFKKDLKVEDKFSVYVGCMTFGHANYIKDAMNGFCMQQTNFPFVCAIVDDASIDGEPAVIQKYLDEHFDLGNKTVTRKEETDDYILTFSRHKTNTNCFFAVFYLKYNHYSIRKSKDAYVSEWAEHAKYHAICEGDDYWIHPKKLQMQVDFLENHPAYNMVCNNTILYSVKKRKVIGNNRCYEQSQEIDVRDVILKGGSFISTCSILYRSKILENYPVYCVNCHVGDYPLQIMAAMKGKVYYFDDVLTVYRTENLDSWCGRQEEMRLSEGRLKGMQSEIQMLHGFQKDYPEYESSFIKRVSDFIFLYMPNRSDDQKGYSRFAKTFKTEIDNLSMIQRMNLLWMKSRFSKTYYLFSQFWIKLSKLLVVVCFLSYK